MGRELTLEAVRITEPAAIAAAEKVGAGDSDGADQAAVDAMRRVLNQVQIVGTVVIGEGEKDEAPMLYIGEQVGTGCGPAVDIAVDPLEGTTIVAEGRQNALCVLAIGERGGFLNAPDVYMMKMAVGPRAAGAIDLRKSVSANCKAVAKALGKPMQYLTVVVLDRPRHQKIIAELRSLAVRIKLISDGDVSAALSTAVPDTGVDMLIGIGGSTEGVLAAAAMRCLGGQIQGRLQPIGADQVKRIKAMKIADPDRIYNTADLAAGDDVIFSATGVTDGDFLKGVRYGEHWIYTHSMVLRAKTGTVRFVQAQHRYEKARVNDRDAGRTA
ncbi:MAG: fructose-bisphosphatase, class II [Candidatus Lindowbacteria bacterium RIFCSPLOWO2_12_FULL_62_27]|nr:MAG: fructose-bisphosphatase, class II [Candidatus Lindowbacteria bacterium RIFCSPLOWO2_12_FULL_62_27]